MRLTDEQFERLPAVLKEIVEVDRRFEQPVIGFKEGCELVARRATLRRVAASHYGRRKSAGDGTA